MDMGLGRRVKMYLKGVGEGVLVGFGFVSGGWEGDDMWWAC